jgi:hypothetical protein
MPDDEESPSKLAELSVVGAVGGGLAAAAGLIDPALGIPAGVAAGGVPALFLLGRQWFRARVRNGDRALAAGATHANVSVDDLVEKASTDEFTLKLAGDAIDAAMRSALDAKIIALGRALATGVMSSDESVAGFEQRVVQALSRVELPEARVLQVISRDYPKKSSFLGLEIGWTEESIRQRLPPSYALLVAPALAVLAGEGLILDRNIGSMNAIAPSGQFRLTDFGGQVLNRLLDAGLNAT